ncbi:hypothetical protein [Lacticaseibacillus zhaodongensis]|uniref:hypothetical protein n=1 Tax=Lacticaseibacillus zhaodongensis TaxID=2668065 RepID=UPI0012D2B626|nr:hypothetical protein [Lacticaseibacillus zhaodongensis]
METFTMTARNRAQMWAQLNAQQLTVLQKYSMYALKSQMFNQIYARGAQWTLVDVRTDYHWDEHKAGRKAAGRLHCMCGRVVKHQYVLQSVTDHRRVVRLGITHFEQEMGIPQAIASEVHQRLNQVELYMDEILTYYKRGRRFPAGLYQEAQARGVLAQNVDATSFAAKMADFAAADFPLFHVDQQRLTQYVLAARAVASQERVVRAPQVVAGEQRGQASAPKRQVSVEEGAVTNFARRLWPERKRSELTVANLWREQPVLKRLWLHDPAALQKFSSAQIAQLRTILQQDVSNRSRLRRLAKPARNYYDAHYPAVVAAQFTQFRKDQADDGALKYSLAWQATLQKLQSRCLFEATRGQVYL